MTYIRRKIVGGREYKYEVESYRDPSGNVRQRVVKYLGPEVPIYGTTNKRRGAATKEPA